MQTAEDIEELKQKYLAFYAAVPIQKYAAQSIGRDEDTILLWRKKDKDFSDKVKQAESEAVRGKLKRVKPEWYLERIFKRDFSERKEVEHSGEVAVPIFGGQSVQADDSDEKDIQPQEED